jgi:hypothetical protein
MTHSADHLQTTREPYRPSCGTEGADFAARWCSLCERDRAFREGRDDGCPIQAATFIYSEDDPAYPVEWREDGPSGPRCTAFEPEQEGVEPLDPAAVVRPLFISGAAPTSGPAHRAEVRSFPCDRRAE